MKIRTVYFVEIVNIFKYATTSALGHHYAMGDMRHREMGSIWSGSSRHRTREYAALLWRLHVNETLQCCSRNVYSRQTEILFNFMLGIRIR